MAIEKQLANPEGLLQNVGPENIIISACDMKKNKHLEGINLKENAQNSDKSISDLILDLLIEEKGQTHIFLNQMNTHISFEENLENISKCNYKEENIKIKKKELSELEKALDLLDKNF